MITLPLVYPCSYLTGKIKDEIGLPFNIKSDTQEE